MNQKDTIFLIDREGDFIESFKDIKGAEDMLKQWIKDDGLEDTKSAVKRGQIQIIEGNVIDIDISVKVDIQRSTK